MSFLRSGPDRPSCRTALLWGFVVLVGACGAPERPERSPPEAPDTSEAEPFQPPTDPTPRPVTTPVATELGLSGGFAHAPHAEVQCTTCHESVPGHQTHSAVACGDCHPPPAGATAARPMAEEECLTCHHLRQTERDCVACHGPGPVGPFTVAASMDLAVTVGPLERDLGFRHGWHGTVGCSVCHSPNSRQAVEGGCATCHEEHHQAESPCGACHFPSPIESHDADAHLGCSGAGCHGAEAERIPRSRRLCLSCHVAQANHEPGGDCSSCHLLEGIGAGVTTPPAGTTWAHPGPSWGPAVDPGDVP